MGEADKILSDAVNNRNRRAWESREGRAPCVAVRKQDDLDWVVNVLADLRRDGFITEEEIASSITSLRKLPLHQSDDHDAD